MKSLAYLFLPVLAACAGVAWGGDKKAENGVVLPANYRSLHVIGVSDRADKESLRVILANDTAFAAIQGHKDHPYPEGAMLIKVAWKRATHPLWEPATVPGAFVQADVMVKDRGNYAATKGWGFARFLGPGLVPQPAKLAQECLACHTAAQADDFVFTHSAEWPTP
jgi:hypothetical protein